MTHSVELEVHQNEEDDVYRDRARIPEDHRGKVREGRICKISVAGQSILLEIRGIVCEPKAIVRLDARTRASLGVQEKSSYAFRIREVGWVGQFLWAWNASDSASRIAARLGLLGVLLGLLGMVFALLPLLKDCSH
jgi:hypothetical protein